MSYKCFCHLNGYKVKDADARKSIEDLTTSLSETNNNIENMRSEFNQNMSDFTSEVNQNMSDFTNVINNHVNTLSENVVKTSSDLVDTNVRIDDNNFNTSAIYLLHNIGLDIFVTENFESPSDIDETKDDGNYVIVNNYDNILHRIVIPSGNIKMIRSKVISVEQNAKKFFVNIEKEGNGTIDVYFSTDSGVTFNPVIQNELVECVKGSQLTVQLKLNGEVTLKNICWGVRF
jgi:hypothetical protein